MNERKLKPGWKIARFGDVVRNANLVERDPAAAGIDKIVGLDDLDPGDLHIRRWDTPREGTSFTRKFTSGQTLFGKRRAYQHKVAYAESEGICSSDILTFEPKDKNALLPGLLPFICQTDAFFEHALGTSAGSLSPRTSWGALSDFEFALPPIEEQKRIAELLWAGEHALETSSCTLDASREIRRAMLHAIFVKKSYFSDNAIDYKDAPLGTLCDIRRGASPRPIGSPVWFSEEGPGWVRISDVSDSGKYLEKTQQCLSKEGLEKSVRVQRGSLIMSICATIGLPVITAIDACIHDGFVVFQNVSPDIMQDYLYYFILASRRAFENQGQLGTQKNLNTAIVKRTALPLPALEAQARCCDLLGNVENGIDETEKYIGTLVAMNTCLRETVLRRSHV